MIAVVQEADVGWHRITLPKAPASRLRAALVGVIEEALLDDAETVHLAVAPLAVAGQPTWVAAVDKAWLQDELAALEKAGVFVDRVVPMAWPDDPPAGHFHAPAGSAIGTLEGTVLTWASVDGVATVRLDGGLARALVPSPAPVTTRWSARRPPPPRPSTGSARRSTSCRPSSGCCRPAAASGTCASSISRGAPAAHARSATGCARR